MKHIASMLLLVVAACVGFMASPSIQKNEIAFAASVDAAPLLVALDLDAMPPSIAVDAIEPYVKASDQSVPLRDDARCIEPIPRPAKRERTRVYHAAYKVPEGHLLLST